jgi:Methyltransferase domain
MSSFSQRKSGWWNVLSLALILILSFVFIFGEHVFLSLSSNVGSCSSLKLSSTYQLAKYESLGFFDDIDNKTWQRHKNRAQSEPIYFEPLNPNEASDEMVRWLFHNVDPIFSCPHSRRVGGRGDGPKWTCDPYRLAQQPDCLIYSIGSQGNFVFEDGIVEILEQSLASNGDKVFSNCEIHVFDPNPVFARKDDAEKNNIHYHAWGLKSSYEAFDESIFPETSEFLSFQEIQQELGHINRRIDIFKIDCEGCEFSNYLDWLSPTVDIRQILIETHGIPKLASTFFDRFFDIGFVPFFKEPNTLAQPGGQLIEWGWLRLHPEFLNRNTSLI